MRRALLLATIVLVLPATAQAHIEAKPPFVNVATDAAITLETPNERESAVMIALVVEAPADVRLVAAAAPPGWQQSVQSERVTYAGGRLLPGTTLGFETTLRAERPGTSTLHVVQRFDDGRTVPWDVELSVLPATGTAAPKQHPERAVLAAIAGVALVGLSLLVVHRLRRRSLQES